MAYCTKCGTAVEGAFCIQCGTPVGASSGSGAAIPPPPPTAPQVSAPPAAGSVPKKRRPLLWILGGCLGLIVIGIIIAFLAGGYFLHKVGVDTGLMKSNPELATAKMILSANPDVEVLSVDESAGTIKVRDKKTGKTLTMNLSDVKKGKIVFQDDQNKTVEFQTQGEGSEAGIEVRSSEGTMRMGTSASPQLPAWLPAYPGAESTGTFSIAKDGGNSGSCAFKSNDSPEKIASFYENALKSAGFTVQKSSTQIPGQGAIIILAGEDSGTQRTAHVTVATGVEKGTTISLVFETK